MKATQVTRHSQGPIILPLSTLTIPTVEGDIPNRVTSEIRSTRDSKKGLTPERRTQGLSVTLLHRQGLDEGLPREENREKTMKDTLN